MKTANKENKRFFQRVKDHWSDLVVLLQQMLKDAKSIITNIYYLILAAGMAGTTAMAVAWIFERTHGLSIWELRLLLLAPGITAVSAFLVFIKSMGKKK